MLHCFWDEFRRKRPEKGYEIACIVCTLFVVVKRYLAKHNVTDLEPPHIPW
jgi:hypothetical protein